MTQVDASERAKLSHFQLLLYLRLFRRLLSSDICNSRRPICQVVAEGFGDVYATHRNRFSRSTREKMAFGGFLWWRGCSVYDELRGVKYKLTL